MDRVLITGAAGGIGRSLRESLLGVYRVLRLSDRVRVELFTAQRMADLGEMDANLMRTAGFEPARH